MSLYLFLAVMVCALCSYLPRMLPLTFFRKEIQSPFIRSLLFYVPYAVLAAMTFPGVFYATGNTTASLIGCMVAIFFAYHNKGLVFVACVAMVTCYVVTLFI